ncbi:TIGR03086 family metal-binding protein [Rhodococcus opacus]|nr:TIGR03086 family metal-binding protein [Rhodococcus opacus]MCZ4586953.1 TIGR03086 family metal-binding protein [Rhodococcus opacus]NHU43632.1 TIGR03086 family protein [Rhodococcus sp. A14]WKN53008.1 TIGR03086 family metal-binding protein [Rhodococcus opacus]WLF44246.1 TIGR03086 family metal-binding protein [Rhodococcus opacus]
MFDLRPAADVMAALVESVRDDQLTAPTPCPELTVGELLDHIDGLSLAFTAAATKTPPAGGSQPPFADAARLGTDWRTRIPQRLAALAGAWREEPAWHGMTQAGGLDLPADIAGAVAVDEIVVHGWDLAVATGQNFHCTPELLGAAYEFAKSSADQNPHGTPGLFGPPVSVPDSAPLLEQLLGLTGRDPRWVPTAT